MRYEPRQELNREWDEAQEPDKAMLLLECFMLLLVPTKPQFLLSFVLYITTKPTNWMCLVWPEELYFIL